MRVTATRKLHVELEDTEVNDLVNALTNVLYLVDKGDDRNFLVEHGYINHLLKLKTELINAPR